MTTTTKTKLLTNDGSNRMLRLTPADLSTLTAGQKRYLTQVHDGYAVNGFEPIFAECKAHIIEIGYRPARESRGRTPTHLSAEPKHERARRGRGSY